VNAVLDVEKELKLKQLKMCRIIGSGQREFTDKNPKANLFLETTEIFGNLTQ
jgi:hypothetical protein